MVSRKKALYWFSKAADQGDDIAQYHLGLMYFQGKVVKQNIKKAESFFALAAEQDHARSQYYLSMICMHPSQNPQKIDFEKGFELLEKSAMNGLNLAQYDLAQCYYHGEYHGNSIVVDYEKAFDLYTLAANQHFAPAEHNLGIMYMSRIGTKKMYALGYKLVESAALKGDGDAKKLINLMRSGAVKKDGW